MRGHVAARRFARAAMPMSRQAFQLMTTVRPGVARGAIDREGIEEGVGRGVVDLTGKARGSRQRTRTG